MHAENETMKHRKAKTVFSLALVVMACEAAGEYSVVSPNGKIACTVRMEERVRYSIRYKDRILLAPSSASMDLGNGRILGFRSRVDRVKRTSVNKTFLCPVPFKRRVVTDAYNEMDIRFREGFSLVFRAYNDGAAYRFVTRLPGTIRVMGEEVLLRFADDDTVYLPLADCAKRTHGEDCFHSSYEEGYTVLRIGSLDPARQGFLPLLVAPSGKPKVLFTESDLIDYPGLWMAGTGDGTPSLRGLFPGFPLKETVAGEAFPQAVVAERAGWIAETRGSRAFPWRVFAIAERDAQLIENDIVYRLGGETEPMDFTWVRPGKSQSEWLYGNNLYGVDFRAGINTETYRFHADFNARFRTGYLFFDAGWSDVTDPLRITPGMDMEGLVRYARGKGLGVFLWTSSLALSRNLVPVLERFAAWGVTGVMVDFMDRDDQAMVNFYERVARESAKRRLAVNFHGAYKPTGLERRFPNLVTREAVMAFEYCKWTDWVTPEYEVSIPFIRMVAGPLDYEPGQMKNAQRDDFRAVDNAPMSQGTRMHQAAMFVVYESPYAKMGGNVSDYLREPDFTEFLARIPTVWEDTRVLDGRVSDYVLIARKSLDGEWYVAAMTDWTARDLTFGFGFLDLGRYGMEIYEDGINADRTGSDARRMERSVTPTDSITIRLAPGGGWVGRIFRK
jgi:alpha-glucosidase